MAKLSLGTSGVRVLKLVFYGLIIGRAAVLLPVSRHLFVGVLCVSGDVDWEGRPVGSSGASKLCGVSQEDEVDVASAQYFVNSSHAPELLLRRGVSLLRMFLRVFVSTVFLRADGMRCIGFGVLSVIRSLRALFGALDALDSSRFAWRLQKGT